MAGQRIKFDDWVTLPKERQRALIIKWARQERSDYEGLALHAAALLKKELSSIPEVTNVDLTGGEVLHSGRPPDIIIEKNLNVLTLLPDSDRLEQIPTQFFGFDVQQENLFHQREAYLKTLKRLFKELKGWDEEKTLQWTEKWSEALSGRDPSLIIYEKGPVDRAVQALVDDDVKKAAGDRLIDLHLQLRGIIYRDGNLPWDLTIHPDLIEDYDWALVRKEIAEATQKFVKG